MGLETGRPSPTNSGRLMKLITREVSLQIIDVSLDFRPIAGYNHCGDND
jgi:hypothetical protein